MAFAARAARHRHTGSALAWPHVALPFVNPAMPMSTRHCGPGPAPPRSQRHLRTAALTPAQAFRLCRRQWERNHGGSTGSCAIEHEPAGTTLVMILASPTLRPPPLPHGDGRTSWGRPAEHQQRQAGAPHGGAAGELFPERQPEKCRHRLHRSGPPAPSLRHSMDIRGQRTPDMSSPMMAGAQLNRHLGASRAAAEGQTFTWYAHALGTFGSPARAICFAVLREPLKCKG